MYESLPFVLILEGLRWGLAGEGGLHIVGHLKESTTPSSTPVVTSRTPHYRFRRTLNYFSLNIRCHRHCFWFISKGFSVLCWSVEYHMLNMLETVVECQQHHTTEGWGQTSFCCKMKASIKDLSAKHSSLSLSWLLKDHTYDCGLKPNNLKKISEKHSTKLKGIWCPPKPGSC